jgi:hypothetical protein
MKKTFALTTENGKLTCPELDGYELPEHQEDDVVSEAWASNPDRTGEAPLMYKAGYTEARDKFEFTREDIRNAFLYAISLTAEGHNGEYSSGNDPDIEIQFGEDADEYIASLRTARTPIAIEVEIDAPIYADDAFGKTYLIGKGVATNPDGTVKGRWVYE